MHPQGKETVEVVCGVVKNLNGEILACLRPTGKHLAGFWEFPGGKVDPDELPKDALVRELHEELGVVVVVEEQLMPVKWSDHATRIRLIPYYCRIAEGEPVALEHEKIAWVKLDEIQLDDWAPADIPILEELMAKIQTVD